MANPQIEEGLTPLANELVEAFSRINLSAYETRLLFWIFRKTYGYHKKTDRISRSQFAKGTGINQRHIWRVLQLLLQRRIVVCIGKGQHLEYGIQKDYDLWLDVKDSHSEPAPNGVQVEDENLHQSAANLHQSAAKPAPIGVQEPAPNGVHTKERKILTKDTDKGKAPATASVPKKSFETYREELKARFTDLDFATEYEKYVLYWSNGRRKCKNPQLALLNWMCRAREYQRERQNGRVSRQMAARNEGAEAIHGRRIDRGDHPPGVARGKPKHDLSTWKQAGADSGEVPDMP